DVSACGGSEAVTQRLWREAGVRVVAGRYLAQEQADGSNPGADYIRVAMVQDKAITAEALHRLGAGLGEGMMTSSLRAQRSNPASLRLDCFVALWAPRNDQGNRMREKPGQTQPCR